jgi:hypothetical protein
VPTKETHQLNNLNDALRSSVHGPILYAKHDYAVFGFGETRQDAIVMAAQCVLNHFTLKELLR